MADRLDELQNAIHAFVAERDRASAHRISAKAMIPVSADE